MVILHCYNLNVQHAGFFVQHDTGSVVLYSLVYHDLGEWTCTYSATEGNDGLHLHSLPAIGKSFHPSGSNKVTGRPEQFLSCAWPPSLASGCCLVCYLFTGLRYCNGRARRWAHTTGVTSECLRSHRSLLSTIAITVVSTIYMDLRWVQLLDLGFGVGGSIRGKPSNFQQGQGRSQSLGKSQTISEIKQLVEQWCHSE